MASETRSDVVGEEDAETTDDGCPLSSLDEDSMDAILSLVDTNDLVALLKTSKHMKDHVQNFASRFAQSDFRAEKINAFLSSDLLTPDEKTIEKNIEKYGKGGSVYLVKVMKECEKIRRFRVFDYIGMDVIGSLNEYMVKKFNSQLQREVYHLNTVCWLHFHAAIMTDIPAGKYQVSIHIIFGPNFHYPCVRDDSVHRDRPDIATHVLVRDEKIAEAGDANTLVEVIIEPEWWEEMKAGTFDQSLLQGNAVLTRNGDCGHLLKLKPFEVVEQHTDLYVEWRDHRNAWWKQDMSWDYVQLEAV